MTDDTPIACSLGAGELEQRLVLIAEIGTEHLISHEVEGGRHLLRFRAGGATRTQLEEIVAAEARCCSFLDLLLVDEGRELVLSINAPEEAQALAAGLADAFGGVAR
jgi:hypothetical protein